MEIDQIGAVRGRGRRKGYGKNKGKVAQRILALRFRQRKLDSKATEEERAGAKEKAKAKEKDQVNQDVSVVDPPRTGAEIARCQDRAV